MKIQKVFKSEHSPTILAVHVDSEGETEAVLTQKMEKAFPDFAILGVSEWLGRDVEFLIQDETIYPQPKQKECQKHCCLVGSWEGTSYQ